MKFDTSFFNRFYNDDIIYHYTKASTAIDFILYKKELKFNSVRSSFDPIESKKAERHTLSNLSNQHEASRLQLFRDINEIYRDIDKLEKHFCQICFCQNEINEDLISVFPHINFDGYEEFLGFTKLRMWDQYADKFAGVCIAFSKQKLLKQNQKKFEIIDGPVQYLSFQELTLKKVGDLYENYLFKVGKDQYKEEIISRVKNSFFYKHRDYSGESKYRIGTLFDISKCSFETIRGENVWDKTMMLDISNCVEAIFVSSFANEWQKKGFLNYAKEGKFEMVEMQWKHDSFLATNYLEWDNFIRKFQDEQ